jgi:hypothetical protein
VGPNRPRLHFQQLCPHHQEIVIKVHLGVDVRRGCDVIAQRTPSTHPFRGSGWRVGRPLIGCSQSPPKPLRPRPPKEAATRRKARRRDEHSIDSHSGTVERCRFAFAFRRQRARNDGSQRNSRRGRGALLIPMGLDCGRAEPTSGSEGRTGACHRKTPIVGLWMCRACPRAGPTRT